MSSVYLREYERPLQELKMPVHYYGFTNRILQQEDSPDKVNYYVPIYLILKIKSIQDIDIQKLTGSISCVMLVYVNVENLPKPIVHMLKSSIQMQINRSELLILKEDRTNNINLKDTGKMLIYTIRKNLSASISADTRWSPFQIIRLIVSITFNSISDKKGYEIKKNYIDQTKKTEEEKGNQFVKNVIQQSVGNEIESKFGKAKDQSYFNQFKKYSFSFNCMRNGSQIPIAYSMGCVYSLYDLAQKKLEVYHTNIDSYSEVMRKFEQRGLPKAKKKQDKSKTDKKYQTTKLNEHQPGSQLQIDSVNNLSELNNLTSQIYEEMQKEGDKKSSKVKAKYFQYTHFVIPLYKYPGNALATIFIPIFLLSLLSLAIFFQPNDLSNRIGSIATMVLGYIALIPSIKEQLPPSSKITILEIVIYISTLCCMFSMVESFLIDEDASYVFHWEVNFLYLICLFIHIGVFIFVGGLMALHVFVWEPSYNLESEARKTDPEVSPHEWINFYCDQEFYKANSKIYQNNKEADKKVSLIQKYEPTHIQQQKNILPQLEKISSQTFEESPKMGFLDAIMLEVQNKNREKEGLPRIEQLQSPIVKLDIPKAEKKEKGPSKPKKQKKKFLYEKYLEYLDKLISQGSHVSYKQNQKIDKVKKIPSNDSEDHFKTE